MSRLQHGLAIALAAFAVCGTAAATPTVSNGPSAKLAGEWRGRSLCVTLLRPACTDETVVYRITQDQPQKEAFHIRMSKIVAGNTELMVDLACRFELTRQQLFCPITGGQWQFRWDGAHLIGGLIDQNNGMVRFVQVNRSAS